MRTFRTFTYKNAHYRFACTLPDIVRKEIIRQREILQKYLISHPAFHHALSPVDPLPEAPEIARRMAWGSRKAGTGPMAAVAGTIAQMSAEAALQAGTDEVIIDNGGDLYLASKETVHIALFTGNPSLMGKIALKVEPEYMPTAVCSSSSKMGHSLSFGKCDLATVIAEDASLADAAATMVCNKVKRKSDIEPVLNSIVNIEGIRGIIISKNDKIGISGNIPEIVKVTDPSLLQKITKDTNSTFFF